MSLLLISCDCDPEFVSGKIRFEIPFNSLPLDDTFKVGDTVWLESHFEHNVYERETRRYYLFDDHFDFQYRIIFGRYNEGFLYDRPFTSQDLIQEIGTIDLTNLHGGGKALDARTFEYDGLYYRYRCGIVLRNPGTYLIYGIGDHTSHLLHRHPHFIDDCTGDYVWDSNVYSKNSSSTEDNYELVVENNILNLNGELITKDEYFEKGMHIFRAKE